MFRSKLMIKIYAAVGLLILLLLLGAFLFSGGNDELIRCILKNDHTNEELRDFLQGLGIRGYITVAVLSMLQVIVTVLPAEPVQVLAGLTFGFPIGLLCCTVGVILGNTLVFLCYRIYGDELQQYFVKNLRFDFEKAARSPHLTAVILILYFLPAIPYGMICFLAASVGMKYPRYITVTLAGAIPSICIGVGLGHMALASSWILSLCVFLVLVVLLVIAMIKKDILFAKLNAFIEKPGYSSKTTVKKCNPFAINLAYWVARVIFFFRGVRVRYIRRVGKIQGPAIVLCNHGSFVDFVYAGSLIRKSCPNFVVARLYFYHRWLGTLLRILGTFPKSMFAADLESAKNCLRVLKNGDVLAMMPEARLSTAGRFEDIQEGTYPFIKRAKVPVYSIHLRGDYLADPKWGRGLRRGSLVEAELDLLFTAEELSSLSLEEIRARVEERLDYNELEWLATRPQVHYRSRRLAEGLENILVRCPHCHQKHSLRTKGRTIFCESCGETVTMNDRYGFPSSAPFANFTQWYAWQFEELQKEILADPGYALTSKVEFRLPSKDGRTMLRHAGDGVCTLDRSGLRYVGTRDGEEVDLFFPIGQIYRLLFGAGENFEIYVGSEIQYFVPEDRRSAVEWYMTSMILVDQAKKETSAVAKKEASKAL
ncbi:MAG: VTT domain-containing protein [Clostridia bacterium]|nr:VTT domain-containing protein [Clostridia bacterium]